MELKKDIKSCQPTTLFNLSTKQILKFNLSTMSTKILLSLHTWFTGQVIEITYLYSICKPCKPRIIYK